MVRFGIIGTNFVTDRMLEAAGQVPDFELGAVYSRTVERAEEYAAAHGVRTTYTSIDGLCRDDSIDAVYIASPNLCHEEQAVALLEAGRHVLCEKPLAPDMGALSRMRAAADRSGRILMEAMLPAHTPSWRRILSLVPRLGKLRRVTLVFCQYSSRYDKFKSGIIENAFRPELKNGALMDIGVYCVHAAQMICGLPDTVDGHAVFLKNRVDGQGTILLGYEDMQAELIYSKITNSAPASQIMGEDGIMTIDSVSLPKSVEITARSGQSEKIDVKCDMNEYTYELADFIQAVKTGEDNFRTGTEHTTQILDAAREKMGINFVPR